MPEAKRRLRSFIAIPLPAPQLQLVGALQQQLCRLSPELKTPRLENLHLTLHFLGDQTEELLAEIGRNMLSIGPKKKYFNVALKGLGFFPSRRRPKVLWLGADPQTDLIDLYHRLAVGLKELGLATDQRPYRPHLTIGRWRQPPRQIEPLCPFLSHGCGNMTVDRMILYSSQLTSRGAIHTPLTTAKLSAADD